LYFLFSFSSRFSVLFPLFPGCFLVHFVDFHGIK
jgi:hypothetical protein